MKRAILNAFVGAFSCVATSAAPLAVGTISDNVGYTEATGWNGNSYQTLAQQRLSDHAGRVVAMLLATPW